MKKTKQGIVFGHPQSSQNPLYDHSGDCNDTERFDPPALLDDEEGHAERNGQQANAARN